MAVNWNEVDKMISNAFAAYGAVSDIKTKRAEERTAADLKAKRAEIADMMAQGPGQTQQAVPTQQSAQLAEQTASMLETPEQAVPAPAQAVPAPAQAAPPGPYPPNAQAIPAATPEGPAPIQEGPTVPETNDPDLAAMEADIQASTGRTVMKSEDWASFEQKLLQKTAALGDPSAVAEMKKYVDGIKQKGFNENAGKAAAAAASGNDKQVQHFLSKAWGYMDTGTSASVVAVPNKPGVYMVTPVSEADADDKGAPKPAGQPIAMDAAMIGSLAQMTEDPAKFWKLQKEFEQKDRTSDIQARRVDLEEARQGTPEQAETKRQTEADKLKWQTKKAKADALKAEKALTDPDTEWNDANNRAVTNDINRHIEQIKSEANEATYDLYDKAGKTIASDAIAIVKALKSYDIPYALNVAEKIANVQGAQLAIDPDTGEAYVVVGDNEYDLDEI